MNRVDLTALVYYGVLFGGPLLGWGLVWLQQQPWTSDDVADALAWAITLLFGLAIIAWGLGPFVAWGSFSYASAALAWSLS